MTARTVTLTAATLVAAVVLAASVLVLPAEAHGDQGILDVVGIQPGSKEHEVRLSVEYAYDDEHAVYRDGALRLSGRSSEGVTLIPQRMSATDVDGLYAVDVVLPPPGTWELRVEGTSPIAATDVRIDSTDPEWLEPGAGSVTSGSDHSGLHVRWDWMLAGFVAVVGWFSVLRWRRRAASGALSDAG